MKEKRKKRKSSYSTSKSLKANVFAKKKADIRKVSLFDGIRKKSMGGVINIKTISILVNITEFIPNLDQ